MLVTETHTRYNEHMGEKIQTMTRLVRMLSQRLTLFCMPGICVCIIACLVFTFISDTHAASRENVLILNSYHQGYKWTDDETRGIIDGLSQQKDSTKLYIEYMGTKLVSTQHYFDQLRETYREKYRTTVFSVIIVTDNDAFDFVRKYRNDMFGQVPVVFAGINWFQDDDLRGHAGYTGVNEDADIAATFDLMLKLHPQTSHIFVVMDTTTTGRIVYDKVQEIMPRYQGRVTFSILQDMPMETILKTVSEAPDNSLVLLTIFQKDSTGVFFEFSESAGALASSSRVPVYGIWDFNLGYGIVGGMLTSGYAQGSSAASLAQRILNGESPASIPVLKKSPNHYMFDYQQLVRFNIDKAGIPDGSTIVNEPPSFYAVNKTLLWTMLGGLIFLSSIVIVLSINIRQRKAAQRELQQAHDELEQRVHDRTADLVHVNELLSSENSERRRAEEEIRKLNAELGEFNQEIENLVSERTMNLMALAVADKVRNPVAIIGATAHRIVEKGACCRDFPIDLQEQLIILSESAEKLESIVADFQSLLKDKRAVFQHLNLNQAVESIVHLFHREADKREVTLSLALHDQPLMINAQEHLLKIALFHVLKNAIEATPFGGRVRIATLREGEKIVLTVHDSGKGIQKSDIAKIFDPFYSTKEHSFGMGLPLVKQVITEHLGEIQVDSEVGEGAIFRITFPTRWKEK